MPNHHATDNAPYLHLTLDQATAQLQFRGDWLLSSQLPGAQEVIDALDSPTPPVRIEYDCSRLGNWDTGLVALLSDVYRAAAERGIENDLNGLPNGAQRLLRLAFTVAERAGARRAVRDIGIAEATGRSILQTTDELLKLLRFSGELLLSIKRLMGGNATFRRPDFWLAIQEASAEALPIVGLISFLIGMIFAFVGVMQLSEFGAGIYTADLVAVAMVREMAPIMTGIIMAGRTGAAYAAHIGTMQANEEVDALKTLGINAIDFLVLPRFFALVLVMPFLTLYASALGIFGGVTVALSMMDVSLVQYLLQTNASLDMNTLLGGLFKSVVYGSMVALTGTQQGIACGSSAMAVGQAVTRAVVMGIVLIVVSAAVLTVVYINLGI